MNSRCFIFIFQVMEDFSFLVLKLSKEFSNSVKGSSKYMYDHVFVCLYFYSRLVIFHAIEQCNFFICIMHFVVLINIVIKQKSLASYKLTYELYKLRGRHDLSPPPRPRNRYATKLHIWGMLPFLVFNYIKCLISV